MINFLSKHFWRGVAIARNNPQILYTIFLIIAIPYAFLLSGQRFFDASNENQDRIERESIGLTQDAFLLIARERLWDPDALNRSIQFFKDKNPYISQFIVVSSNNGSSTIIASLDPKEIGRQDESNKRIATEQEGIIKTQTLLVQVYINGERHIIAFRGITGDSGNLIAYFMTDFSMKWLDDLSAGNIVNAYLFLLFIIGAIFFLLIRQARILDYTVLYRRLKEVDKMKDDFISMAAHELRTPLTIIRGYVDILGDIPDLNEKNKENLRRIDVSAKQLGTLVGDILDVTRLEQGRMSFVPENFDIGKAVQEITDSFQKVASEKNLTLFCEIEKNLPSILADKDRMRQVMTNLIGNSVKYTIKGGVVVKGSFDPLQKKVVIRVSDTGIGISAEEQKRLFEKFYRIRNSETENVQGTGLGLWITEQIVNMMKGEISVESIKGKGTDFIVRFPVPSPKE
jgi:signal transduction histidine kinase